MKKKTLFLLPLAVLLFVTPACTKRSESEAAASAKAQSGTIEITDMIGRSVVLNGYARTALAEEPATLRLYVYVAGTEKLLGVSERETRGAACRPYALAHPELQNMTVFGGSYSIQNFEQVLTAKPDVFFVYPDEAAAINRIQEQCNVPVVTLDYGTGVIFDPKVYKSIELIGRCIGKEQRAQEVINFMEECKKDLYNRTKDIPDSEKLTVYAGGLAWNGPHGIEGTRENYPLFEAVNAVNVVKGINRDGMVMIDKEKLLEWEPDIIFIDLASIHLIQEDYNKNKAYYNSLSAFKNGRVYAQLPFVWCNENIDTAIADAYFIGKKVYPHKFEDVEPEKKADEIYTFLTGKALYAEFAASVYGGFHTISLEALEQNTYLKE